MLHKIIGSLKACQLMRKADVLLAAERIYNLIKLVHNIEALSVIKLREHHCILEKARQFMRIAGMFFGFLK